MRIMHVNTLYPPNGGGATVLCDHVCQRLAEKNKISVFAGRFDFGNETGHVKTKEQGRVNVRTVNIRGLFEFNIDAVIDGLRRENYYNPAIGEVFGGYLDEIRPEIVHFHSVQWLGANLIEEAARFGAGIVLTMHDWWWVCARQFLVDLGRDICPFDNALSRECCGNSVGFKERNAYLFDVLKKVDRVLVPSELLKSSLEKKGLAGFDIRVVENGIERPSGEPEKKPLPEGKVVFGYFGGENWLKGLDTIRDAVLKINSGDFVVKLYNFDPSRDHSNDFFSGRTTRPASNSLLVKAVRKVLSTINGRRYGRGVGKIEFHPPFSQDKLDGVLSGVDVMLLPSLQRESFSLVTREAMARGVPVIASDSGGPEEIIKDGVNGFIFRTKDSGALASKMEAFIKDPSLVGRMRAEIRPSEIRYLDEHVEELNEIYAEAMSK